MEIKDNFPLHTIKKIKRIGDRYDDYHGTFPVETQVNQLLSKGWVLLALETEEVSPKNQRTVFTLGHTDPSADDSIEYTSNALKGVQIEQ